jgi:phosphoribosyl 1,2-cyclic phosphodiesterase
VRVTVLASGSSGNAILVEAAGTKILVDAGMPPRRLDQWLKNAGLGVSLEDVQAVVCTHEHGDHGGGVPALHSAGIAVHTTGGTARALQLPGAKLCAAGEAFELGALRIEPIAVPHDAAEPVAFILSDGFARVGVLVDCGHADAEIAEAFAGCDTLVLEANHDVDLLRAGAYPPTLKRRIAGHLGHLSNEQCADMLRMMARAARPRPLPRVLVLAHLSQHNNKPKLARAAVEKALPAVGKPTLILAPQERATSPIEMEGGRVRVLPEGSQRQLSLAFGD